MKRYIYIAAMAALAGLTTLSSCEDFLDTENYTQKTTGNFLCRISRASHRHFTFWRVAVLANLQIYVKSILQKFLLPPDTAAIKGK